MMEVILMLRFKVINILIDFNEELNQSVDELHHCLAQLGDIVPPDARARALHWLLSMQRGSSSTLFPSQVTELLALPIKESPDIGRRKLISAVCIGDLVLSVATHSLRP